MPRIPLALVVGLLLLGATAGVPANDAVRAVVQAFVARMGEVEIRDMVIDQRITVYHPDGLHPTAHSEQRRLIKPPGRERIEEVIDGRREVKVTVGGRTWTRRADGKTFEVPPAAHERGGSHLMVPLKRSADELLAGWRTFGVRAEVSDTVRVRGRAITLIGARAGDHQSPAVWLDPDWGVVRFISRETLPKGPVTVDVTLSEHRPLRGAVHFPYRQEWFVDGKLQFLVNVKSAVANVDLPDALFDPKALEREK